MEITYKLDKEDIVLYSAYNFTKYVDAGKERIRKKTWNYIFVILIALIFFTAVTDIAWYWLLPVAVIVAVVAVLYLPHAQKKKISKETAEALKTDASDQTTEFSNLNISYSGIELERGGKYEYYELIDVVAVSVVAGNVYIHIDDLTAIIIPADSITEAETKQILEYLSDKEHHIIEKF